MGLKYKRLGKGVYVNGHELKLPDASSVPIYVVIEKASGDYRVCIDYRAVNSLTRRNAFPLGEKKGMRRSHR